MGNITSKDGVNYSYGAKPHTVTNVGLKSYTYDANCNMTGGDNLTITWDMENRPKTITKNAVTTEFKYDGDGNRVKQTVGNVTTTYVNRYYEKTGNEVTTNDYLGSKLIAVKKGAALSYIMQDHLGSTSGSVAYNGTLTGTISYFNFGSVRSSMGTSPTDKKFTGQRLDSTGLYYYNARYYDPEIGRFISADTIVPDSANPQSLNRYSYCINNPLKYTDPSGHILPVLAIIGLGLLAVNVASTLYDLYQYQRNPSNENAIYAFADMVDPNPIPTRVWVGFTTVALTKYTTQKALREATHGVAQLARNGIKSASLGDKDARIWYLKQLKSIPNLLNKNLSLEEQAKKAYELRNSFKGETRDLMANKISANKLDLDEPFKSWEELYQKAIDDGKTGNGIYQAIIESSQRSRQSVNDLLGIVEGVDY